MYEYQFLTGFKFSRVSKHRNYLHRDSEEVVLVSVVCGSGPNYKEFLTLVKSAILFQTSSRIRFIVVSDFSMHLKLDEKVSLSVIYNLLPLPLTVKKYYGRVFSTAKTVYSGN